MKPDQLIDAIGLIEDEDILDANRELLPDAYQPAGAKRFIRKEKRKRLAVCIAAAMALMIGSFVTTMASNDAMRRAVLYYMRSTLPKLSLTKGAEEPADAAAGKLPEGSDGAVSAAKELLAGRTGSAYAAKELQAAGSDGCVNIEYITLDEDSGLGMGILYLAGEEGRADAFYLVQDGQLQMLETKETALRYEWGGSQYDIAFRWCRLNGKVHIAALGKAVSEDCFWYISPIPGSIDRVRLCISRSAQGKQLEHTALVELATGNVTDPLAELGANKIENIVSTEFSPDMTSAIITSGNGAVYFGDLTDKKLFDITEQINESPRESWLFGAGKVLCYCISAILMLVFLLYYFPIYRMVFVSGIHRYYNAEEVRKLISIGSSADRAEVQQVLIQAGGAMHDISHSKRSLEESYGLLARYATPADRNAVYAESSLELLSAHLKDNEGCLWVYYSIRAFDRYGETVLERPQTASLWKIRKDETGEWKVVAIKEHR